LPGGSKSGKQFAYAYNLLGATSDRDDETVSNAALEAQAITQIWRAAILEEDRVGKLAHCYAYMYCSLLNRNLNADVQESSAFVQKDVAALLWKRMTNDKDEHVFYYCADAEIKVGAYKCPRQPYDKAKTDRTHLKLYPT
jgi:hypothetical protein